MSDTETKRDEKPKGRHRIVFWGYCFAGVFFWVLFFILGVPFCEGIPRDLAWRMTCSANLSALGKAQALYQAAHHDRLPSDFGELIPEGFSDGYIEMQNFACPGVRDGGLNKRLEEEYDRHNPRTVNGWIPLISSESDYILIFRHSRIDLLPSDGAVQVYELPENHVHRGEIRGMNVLNFNGSVSWKEGLSYRPMVQESHDQLNTFRKEAGR